jgi:chromosome segregation ATPase
LILEDVKFSISCIGLSNIYVLKINVINDGIIYLYEKIIYAVFEELVTVEITANDIESHYIKCFSDLDSDLDEVNENINNLSKHIEKLNNQVDIIDKQLAIVNGKKGEDDRKDYSAINKLYEKRSWVLAEIESYQKGLNELLNIRYRYRTETNKLKSIVLKQKIDRPDSSDSISNLHVIDYLKKISRQIRTPVPIEDGILSDVIMELNSDEYRMD